MYITMRYKIIFLCFFFTKEKWLNFFVCDIAFIINTRVIYAHARTHIYHLPRKNEDAEANRRPAKVILAKIRMGSMASCVNKNICRESSGYPRLHFVSFRVVVHGKHFSCRPP
eukprot:GEMP01061995.1.p1 GENE.GEMP01061995.1~~GEMP01061995.1.p1  ORF type:complete len:113 (-),score=5.09 GEMP01061995.1:893-1231(-)